MIINITKSGRWAHKGIYIVDVEEGVQVYEESLANELIDNGWASVYDEKEQEKETFPKVDVEEGVQVYEESLANELIDNGWASVYDEKEQEKETFPKVEQKRRGWWSVTFEGMEEISVRGAENAKDAIEMAKTKIEAE